DNYIFSCGRSSPIWDVSEGAKTTEERERTMSLAHPKKAHPRYQPEKPCIWPVSGAARKASPSPRVELLARPKTRSEGLHREPTWAVPPSAMRTVASARVQELAKAKQTAEGYEHCKELDEPIPRSVLRASATERIKSLSRPIVRETMDHVQFNPDAFKVSPAALKGRMPDRIAELAQTISRR
ncbi:testicular haploid expressed gene protein-like, partial [Actinia tenebrosa]|uniref:Testicular haploid expressed gene protein-like n=1 Tax=Actinia tenebrosa TaxID=6105 RepID=A0A6P8J1S3_ACTTE